MAAGQLGAPLFPTHELKDKRRDEAARWGFGKAMDAWNRHEYPKAVGMFRQYLEDYPDSPWAAEAALHVGCDAAYNGRTSEAETIFSKLIAEHQGQEHPGARMLLNKARQRLAVVEMEQNNLEGAALHLRDLLRESPDWRHRTYASHWLVRLSKLAAAREALANCGAEALAYALRSQGRAAAAAQVQTNFPPTMRGHSLASLAELSAGQGLEVAALEVTPAEVPALSLPAILQVRPHAPARTGHYWVLDKVQGDRLELYDPQSERRMHQTVEELAREWTGRVLVFSKGGPLPGRRLQAQEMEESSGRCCGVPRNEADLGCPGIGSYPPGLNLIGLVQAIAAGSQGGGGSPPGGCAGCAPGGAPQWSVNVISMNLFVSDMPLWYNPPIGPSVSIQLCYNSQSAIAQNEPFGNKWQFNYATYLVVDTAGTVTVFMPDGRRDAYTPNGSGGYSRPYKVFNTLSQLAANHFELRFPDDTVYVYQIPPGTGSQQPFLTEIRDAHGQQVSLAYDSNVRLTTITDAQGLVTTLSYSAFGLVTNVADPFGCNASFEYDDNLNLTRSTDMGGYWSSYTYDTNVYLTSISDERGSSSFRVEPADGIENGPNPYPPPGGAMFQNYRITITDPLGHSSEYHYDGYSSYAWYVSPRDYVPWRSDSENNFSLNVPKTTYSFEQVNFARQGEVSGIDDPAGGVTQFSYDTTVGQVASVTDAHGHTWSYLYNPMGRVTQATDPLGTSTSYSYATNAVDLVGVLDGLGQTRLSYDAQHDLLSLTDALTNTTTFAYNGFGQLVQKVDALAITNEYLYDSSQRLSELRRAGMTVAGCTYDTVGRVRTRTDASGLTLTNDYSGLNQITRVTYPDGRFESYAYSTCCPGLLDSTTDCAGRTTVFIHDNLKRLIQTINPEGGATQLAYDANGNRSQLIDANGNVTTFSYDLANRLVGKTYADGKGPSFGHDLAGLLTNRTNARGVVTTYTYDANHNLRTTSYSDDTPGVTNTYDAFNRLTAVTDGVGVSTYAYNANSRVTRFDGPWPDDTITYTYDALGRRTSVGAQGSQSTSYDHDALSRVTAVHVGPQSYVYTYAAASPLVQRLDRPNGSFTTCQYDGLNRLTGVSNRRSTGEVINEFLYAYDAQDMRASETVSNGLSLTLTNQQVTYNYNRLNQLLASAPAGQAFAYDDDGNMTGGFAPSGEAFSAAYDAENRLKTITVGSAGQLRRADYSYSGYGLLAEAREYLNLSLSNDTRYVRDGFLTLQERDSGNQIAREYEWGRHLGAGIGGLLHLAYAGQDYAYCYDGKGSVVTVLDATQASVAAYAYDEFGSPLGKLGTFEQPYRFSTRPYDENTGLLQYPYRAYAPALGRWLSRDALGEQKDGCLYPFVGNSPVQRVDSLGLQLSASGPADPSITTIVCDGKGGIRPQYGTDNGFLTDPCVIDCIFEHELSHARDVLGFNPGLCLGKADGTQIIGEAYNGELNQSERMAYTVELACLSYPYSKPCFKCDRASIWEAIRNARYQRDQYK